MTCLKLVYDPSHAPQKLGEKIAEGGEGSIWTLNNPKLASTIVKLFHPRKLSQTDFKSQMVQKIIAMKTLRNNDKSVAWPYFPVYDEKREFVGFVMRRVEGKELSAVMHPIASKSICRDWNRGNYVLLALNLAQKIRSLHGKGVIIGDLNPNNLLVNTGTCSLRFIDTDSYQLSFNGKSFRCQVGMPEYTPPEHQGLNFATFDRSKESDYFAAAVLIFQMLMRGRHPFDIVGGVGPVENIKRGNFVYGTNQGKLVPKGNWIKLWSHLPRRIKDMFHRAFVDGLSNPGARPDTDEWSNVLQIYLSDSGKGWHDLSLRPTDFKSRDYQGKRAI